MNFLLLQSLSHNDLGAAVDLDHRCLGGLWTENGYQREIDSPNSDLFGLYLNQSAGQSTPAQSDQSHPNQLHPNQLHPDRSHQLNQLNQRQTAPSSADQQLPRLIGLACVWAILNEAHITLLAIDSDYRGQGLGQTLLYALLVSAHQRQMEWATLEVRVSNRPALLLYQKFGFEQVGQRPGYYQDTGEAALILWRKGLQKPSFQTCLQQWHNEIELRLHQANYHLSAPSLWSGSDPLASEETAPTALVDSVAADYSSVSLLD